MKKTSFLLLYPLSFFYIFLSMTFLYILNLPSIEAAEKVRVGYFLDLKGYQDLSPEGTRSGYGYDYLQEIAQYNGWEYEYVPGTYYECLTMLKEGKIDLMGAILKTADTEAVYDFAAMPTGNNYFGLLAAENQLKYAYEDFPGFNGMRVGMIDTPYSRQAFDAFCKKHHIEMAPSFYAANTELINALHAGTIDAVLLNSINIVTRTEHLHLLSQVSPTPLYFATTKGNETVLRGLTAAMRQIQSDIPFFDTQLIMNHYDSIAPLPPAFTKEELRYIQTRPVVTVLYDPNWIPIEYRDAQTGECKGITAEFFNELENRTGLKFSFQTFDTFTSVMEKLRSGEADVLTAILHDYNHGSQNKVRLTQPYLSIPIVMVSRYDVFNPEQKIALPRNFYINQQIINRHPNAEIQYYDSVEQCFEAVRRNEATATFTNAYTANYYLSLTKYMAFTSITLTELNEKISIAVSNSADPRLLSILNKGIQAITKNKMNQIIYQNVITPQKLNWRDIIYANPLGTVSAILFFTAAVIICLSYILLTKNRLRKKAESMLYKDALTGYASYAKFLRDAPRHMQNDAKSRFALIYMDMLQFKYINDTFGYEEGDRVLIEISKFLQGFILDNEAFTRIYADHFALLLKYKTFEEFDCRISLLEQNLTALSQEMKNKYSFIFHGGIYLFSSKEQKIEIAIDRANYAKDTIQDASRTVYAYYDDRMRSRVIKNKQLERQMYPALQNNEFIPYLQPKINLVTGELAGAEALVRWKTPAGPIPPGEFIPFFEQNGFVVHLDFYIYEEICKKLQEWIQAGKKVFPISCNFSRLHIKNPQFSERLEEIANRYQIPHHLLELEITESVAIEDKHALSGCLKLLKELGFVISIDDFGAGYSSLGLIQNLPIDILKLDRNFVINGLRGELEKDLVEALIHIPSKHKISVICEGIETKSQEDFIKKIGCHLAQGFLYDKPMPVGEFEKKYFPNKK